MSCMPKDVSKESLDEIFAVVRRSMDMERKTLLLIAENDVRTTDIRNLLAGADLEIVDVPNLAAGAKVVSERQVDGIVLDWVLRTRRGSSLLNRYNRSRRCVRRDRGVGQQETIGPAGCRDSPLRQSGRGAVCTDHRAAAG